MPKTARQLFGRGVKDEALLLGDDRVERLGCAAQEGGRQGGLESGARLEDPSRRSDPPRQVPRRWSLVLDDRQLTRALGRQLGDDDAMDVDEQAAIADLPDEDRHALLDLDHEAIRQGDPHGCRVGPIGVDGWQGEQVGGQPRRVEREEVGSGLPIEADGRQDGRLAGEVGAAHDDTVVAQAEGGDAVMP